MKYYSQYQQDRFIDEVVLNKKKNGFFIDVGAHDGVSLSNSYFFEKIRGYSGVCVEPNPLVFKKLGNNRNCILVNACIGSENGKANFLSITGTGEMLSGLLEYYDKAHLDRISETIKNYGGTQTIIQVDVITFEKVYEKSEGIVDFCSIDTEGNEYSILKSIDFTKIKIKCFTIENNYNDQRITELLNERNYRKIKSLGCDNVFLNNEFNNLFFQLRFLRYKMNNFSTRVLEKIKMQYHRIFKAA